MGANAMSAEAKIEAKRWERTVYSPYDGRRCADADKAGAKRAIDPRMFSERNALHLLREYEHGCAFDLASPRTASQRANEYLRIAFRGADDCYCAPDDVAADRSQAAPFTPAIQMMVQKIVQYRKTPEATSQRGYGGPNSSSIEAELSNSSRSSWLN
jgi:hypothetical protein